MPPCRRPSATAKQRATAAAPIGARYTSGPSSSGKGAPTASITINTNTEKLQGIKGYLAAIVLNAGGPILWLAVQYISLFATGVAVNDGSALSGIMMVAMVPTLSIAAIVSRNLYKKTGNIWAPAFLNAILMTTMTIANTMVAFK